MKITVTALFSVLLLSCLTPNKSTLNLSLHMIANYDSLDGYKSKEIIAIGVVKEEKFVNKGGKEMDFTELWLEMNDGRQIMLRQKGKKSAKDFVNRKSAVQGVLFYGNIDSDNPNAQSRVGYRLDYTDITWTKD